jgi:hypothetical protein
MSQIESDPERPSNAFICSISDTENDHLGNETLAIHRSCEINHQVPTTILPRLFLQPKLAVKKYRVWSIYMVLRLGSIDICYLRVGDDDDMTMVLPFRLCIFLYFTCIELGQTDRIRDRIHPSSPVPLPYPDSSSIAHLRCLPHNFYLFWSDGLFYRVLSKIYVLGKATPTPKFQSQIGIIKRRYILTIC